MKNKELNLFIPLTKVDEEKRLVYGIATAEHPDQSNEICDYESSVPFYKEWSSMIEKASEGKSKGNLRVMHGSKAAGKITDVFFNDAQKQIEICAKVVDEAEWEKVVEGVYTGFSQGGKYIKSWKDGKYTRYTAAPSEISLVDNPCLSSATFTLLRATGVNELVKFKSVEATQEEYTLAQVWKAKDGSTFAKKADAIQHNAELDAKILTASVQQATDALKAELDKMEGCGHATETQNTTEKEASNPTEAEAKVETPAEPAPIATPSDGSGTQQEATQKAVCDFLGKFIKKNKLAKGLHDVARAACLIQELHWLSESLQMDTEVEQDNSEAVNKLDLIIKELGDFLRMFVEEETKEMVNDADSSDIMAMAAKLPENEALALCKFVEGSTLEKELQKAGSRHSKKDMQHISDAYNHAMDIKKQAKRIHKNSKPSEAGDPQSPVLAKAHMQSSKIKKSVKRMLKSLSNLGLGVDEAKDNRVKKLAKEAKKTETLEKVEAENNALLKQLTSLTGSIEAMTKRIQHLESQPMPAKGSLYQVEKGHEVRLTGNKASVETSTKFTGIPSNISPAEYRKKFLA